MQPIMRLVIGIIAILGATSLSGCLSSNLAAGIPPEHARLVYGVRSEVPPMKFGVFVGGYPTVHMELVDTGTSLPACQNGKKFLAVPDNQNTLGPSVHYFVFDVPAGAYQVDSWQGVEPDGLLFYSVPSGQTVYIGDYLIAETTAEVLQETGRRFDTGFRRDLETAKRALGRIGQTMVMAESVGGPDGAVRVTRPNDIKCAYVIPERIKPLRSFSSSYN